MDTKSKIGACAGIIAILAAGGGYFYVDSVKSTPEYAMQTIEQSVTNHDTDNFYKFVNVDSVVEDSYYSIVEGLTYSATMPDDAKDAIKNFTNMFKAPLVDSLKAAINSYVATGDFNPQDTEIINEILTRTGIDRIQYRGVNDIKINPSNSNSAIANILIYQPELGREFTIEAVLTRTDENGWRITKINNFNDFINHLNIVRLEQNSRYLNQIDEINSRHDALVSDAEQKYAAVLNKGSISQDSTRADLRAVMLDDIKADWEARKREIAALAIPKGSEFVHNLQINICDAEIVYAETYAQWLTDRKASTVTFAQDKKNQANALRAEYVALTGRLPIMPDDKSGESN